MKKIILSLLLSLLIFIPLLAEEKQNQNGQTHVLILLDGSEYRGYLKFIDTEKVIFIIDGEEKVFDKKEVSKINFQQSRLYENVTHIKEIKDRDIKTAWMRSKRYKADKYNRIVYLLDKSDISFDGEYIVERIKVAAKVLNENGKDFKTQYFYYMKNFEKAKLLYGLTVTKDGQVYHVDQEAINDDALNNRYPQYDFLHRVKFGLKKIDVESFFVWEAEIRTLYDPLHSPLYYREDLISYYETVRKELRIKGPASTPLNVFRYDGLMGYKNPLVLRGPGKISVIQNRMFEYDSSEDDLPSNSVLYPSLFISRDTSWKDISKEYYDRYFSANIDDVLEGFLKKAGITKGEPEPTAHLIYDYINRKIESSDTDVYDVAYRLSDIEVIKSANVLNELDKTYLFVRLCNYLGLEGALVFYRDNDDNNIIEECPSLYQLGSLLCWVKLDGKKHYFSFSSSNYAPEQREFRSSESGALEILSGGSELYTLEAVQPEQNLMEIEYLCSLGEDNSLQVKRTTTYHGILQAGYRQKRLYTKKDLDTWFTSRINNLGNNISIRGYRFVNPLEDFSKPVIIEEEFTINNYSYSPGHKIMLFRLPGFEFDASSVAASARYLPYDNGIVYTKNISYTILLPPGYSPAVLPEPISADTDYYAYNAAYEIGETSISFTYYAQTKEQFIPPDDEVYYQFKKDQEQKADYSRKWILLEYNNEK